jgi:hypothetical protein
MEGPPRKGHFSPAGCFSEKRYFRGIEDLAALKQNVPEEGMLKKRRLLLITTRSLFGTGILSLLEKQGTRLLIEQVSDMETAARTCNTFRPDVIVDFRETSTPEDQAVLQDLVEHCHARIIHCTLEANQLTIYEKTRIQNATVEDLMAAVLKDPVSHPTGR